MSLPDEMLDELLSGYLDGVLSADERARVEQLLRDDAAVEPRFNELKDRHQLTSEAALPAPQLPVQFAETVVTAAIETAHAEQLSPDHPLILAARSATVGLPDQIETQHKRSSAVRIAGLIAGLAASVTAAGFLLTRDGGNDDHTTINALANLDPLTPHSDNASELNSGGVLDGGSDVVPDPLLANGTVELPENMLAENSTGLVTGGGTTSVEKTIDSVSTPSTPDMKDVAVAPVGASDTPNTTQETPPEVAPKPILRLASLLVVEIRLTDTGHLSSSFDKAMAAVKIQSGGSRQIDDTVARAAQAGGESKDGSTQPPERVILLEAPMKKLDQLVSRLYSDGKGVESVGLSLLSNAAILRSVDSVRNLDPTTVRQDGRSIELQGETQEVFDGWTDQVGGVGFSPYPKGTGLGGKSTGPSPMSNMLILVR